MIVATVTSGIPAEKTKKGIAMPPKGGSSINDAQVKAVAAYVYSLSHK
jgi:mono/diheme cytochrome c family protein